MAVANWPHAAIPGRVTNGLTFLSCSDITVHLETPSPGLPICTDGGRIHSQLGSGLLGPIKPGVARPDIRVDVDPVYRFGRRFS